MHVLRGLFDLRSWLHLSDTLYLLISVFNYSFISRMKPTESWWLTFLMCSWILLTIFLYFCIYSSEEWSIVLFILFLFCFYLILVSGWYCLCKNYLTVSLLFLFWRSLRNISANCIRDLVEFNSESIWISTLPNLNIFVTISVSCLLQFHSSCLSHLGLVLFGYVNLESYTSLLYFPIT